MDAVDVENQAWLGRVTCGWKLPHLDLDAVRPYWRDAHSPAIARRRGIYEYRHYPLDPIRPDVFDPVPGVDLAGRPGEQLMWLSDVRYADRAGLEAFGGSPGPEVRAQILADIEMIVDRSTTYRVLGDNGRTLVDASDDPAPAGPSPRPTFEVFLRRRGAEPAFREAVRGLAARWAGAPGVVRVRLSLFEAPDMEAERASGYPVKTHPVEQQYQAWIDLAVEREADARPLLQGVDLAEQVLAAHCHPAPAVYTFNHLGRPTLAGLRGYAACKAIAELGAGHQRTPGLLDWMYGEAAHGVGA